MTAARRLTTLATLLAAATIAAGCGVNNPYQHARSTPVKTTVKTTISTRPVVIEPDDARAVLRRYALLSINWTSHTLVAHQHQLAHLATGGARAQALQTAATYGTGSTLQESGVANHGQITSIAAGEGPAAGQWVITTRETTTGRGDYTGLPSQPHIYQAQLAHTPHGWEVSTWTPQN
jgi:hypothetical protein